jgi:hypothetical protein
MTRRQAVFAGVAVVVAVGAGLAWSLAGGGPAASVKAALAGLVAAAVAGLAVSLLRQADRRGVVIGGFFVGAGILSWTYTDRPLVVWGTLLAEGVLFAVWSWPWLRDLRTSFGMGTAWLGVAYWLLGMIGALLVLHAGVAGQRLLYAGVFGLAVVAVVKYSRLGDLSTGIVVAFLFALALLLLAGSGNLFEPTHVVPDNAWGRGFEYRFWGGPWLLYQPNSMAAVAVAAACRIGPDRAFAAWQRLTTTALAGFVVLVTNSRTGFFFLGAAALVHAALLWWRRRRPVADLPDYGGTGRRVAAAAVPFVVLALVLAFAGGTDFLLRERYGANAGVTSGRVDTWKQVFREWQAGGIVQQAFGDTRTARAVVIRPSSGTDIQLTTDNAAVGALRRAGVLGVAAFLFGLALVLWHARRRDAPAWYIVAVLACLPPIVTSDALLGGTGGTVWALLVAGEAWVLVGPRAGEPVLAAEPAERMTSP